MMDRQDERAELISTLATLPATKRLAAIEDYRCRSEQAFAPDTLRNFRQIVRGFRKWCDAKGLSSTPPIPPGIIAAYVEDLGGKLSANTIETRLWALAELHRSQFLPNPCRNRIVGLALKGVKRIHGTRARQANPIYKSEAYRVATNLGDARSEVRDKALIVLMSDSWCRVSEVVALRVDDFSREEDGSGLLSIRRSKTDQFGQGDFAFLSEYGCRLLIDWIRLAGLKSEHPIFTKSQGNGKKSALNTATVGRIIKKRFARSDVSSHSFRVGGVHDAFRIGCSLSSIMVAGRWRSPEMPARYGRRILVSQSAAAEVARAHERQIAAFLRSRRKGSMRSGTFNPTTHGCTPIPRLFRGLIGLADPAIPPTKA